MGYLLVHLAYLLSAALSVYAWQLPHSRIQSRSTASARPTITLQQSQILDFFQKDKDTFKSVEDFDEDLAAEINDALLSADVDGMVSSTVGSSSDEQTTISAAASISETSSSDETLVNSEKQIIPHTPIQTKAPKVDTTPPHTGLAQVMANQLNIDLAYVTPSNGNKISASDVEYYAWKMSQPPSTPEALARAYQLGLDLNSLYDDEDKEYVMQLSDVQLYEENSRSLRVVSQRRRGAPTDVNTKTKLRMKKLSVIDERMEKRMELLAKKLGSVADGIAKTVKLQTNDVNLALVKIEKKDEPEIKSVEDFDAALATEIQEALMSAGFVDENNGHQIGSDESLESIKDVVPDLDAEPIDIKSVHDFDTTLAVKITDSNSKTDSHALNFEADKPPESIYDMEADANGELETIHSISDVDTSAEVELQMIHKSMTCAEIKEELEMHGVKACGKKSELAKRLYTLKTFQSMTVDQLKQDLRKQGLKVSGKKAELVERLIYAKENEKKTDGSLFFVDMQ